MDIFKIAILLGLGAVALAPPAFAASTQCGADRLGDSPPAVNFLIETKRP